MSVDIRKFIIGFLIYGVGSLAQSAAGFLLIPIFTKAYSSAEYGLYTMIWLVGSIFSSFLYLGIASALPKFFYQDRHEIKQKSVFSTGYFLVFLAAAFQSLIGLIFSSAISNIFFETTNYKQHIYLSIAGGAVTFLNYYLASFLRVLDKALSFVLFNVSLMLVTLGVTYVLIEHQSDKLISPFVAALVVNLIFCVLLSGYFVATRWLGFAIDTALAKAIVIFGLPMALSSMASMVVDWSDRFILEYFSGLGAVGIYSVAYKIAGLVNVALVTPFVQIWGPLMMKKKDDVNVASFFLNVFQGYLLASCFIVLFVILFYADLAPYVVRSNAYGDISTLVLMLTIGLLVYGLGNILYGGLLFASKTKLVMWINYSCALINVALSFALIPFYGAYGAATSTLVAYLLIPFMMHYFSKQYFDFNPFKKSFIKITLSILVLILCFILSRGFVQPVLWLKIGLYFIVSILLIFIYFHQFLLSMDLATKFKNMWITSSERK